MIRLQRKIFFTGEHTDSAGNTRMYTPQELGAMVDAYNSFGYRVPIIIGHRDTPLWAESVEEVPFYGRIESMLLDEQGAVVATFTDMSDELISWLNRDAVEFSIALFAPDHPANPKKGVFFPRHLAIVSAPALKTPPQEALAFSTCICCAPPEDTNLTGDIMSNPQQPIQTEQPNAPQQPHTFQPAEEVMQPVMYGYGMQPQSPQLSPTPQMSSYIPQWPTGQQPMSPQGQQQFQQQPMSPQGQQPMSPQGQQPMSPQGQQPIPPTGQHQFQQQQQPMPPQQQPQVPVYDPFSTEDAQFCEQLMSDGRLTPVQANLASFILRHVDTQPRFQFQEPRTGQQLQVSMRDVLRDFFKMLPKQVEYGAYTPPSGQHTDYKSDPTTDAQVEARLKEYF